LSRGHSEAASCWQRDAAPFGLRLCLNRHIFCRRAEDDIASSQARALGRQRQGGSERVPGGREAPVGGALWEAQLGGKAPFAKPLKGFGGAGVLEIVDDFDGDTYRAVYTVRFPGIVYVLHAFQKKSKRGRATPRADIDLIDQRLRRAKEDYEQWSRSVKR
jgi:phage-related protein